MSHYFSQLTSAIGIAFLLAASAFGQVGDSTLPLDVGSDHMENLDSENRTLLVGNVDIVQGDSRLMADNVDIFYSESETGGRGDIERIIATGSVRYFSPMQNARGDRGVYDIETDSISLTGDVVITQCENVITTNFFSTNLTTGDSVFGETNDGQRVRAVLFPQEQSDNSDSEEPEC